MDHQHVLALVEADDGAELHAVHGLALDAGFGDDVGHCGSLRCVAGLEGSGTDRGAKDWGLSGRKNMPSWKLSAMRSARSMKMTATSPGQTSTRSAERRDGKERISKCRSRWSPLH